jgi:predicted aconitase
MYLTKDEEKLLESDNPTIAKCMEILVALGEIFEAEKLIPVKSSHISGISYQNIGDEGLEWLESLNARVVVKTTVNPAGMDLERWKEMGIDEDFVNKQIRIVEALKKLGAEITLTCTPYYIHKPSYGDHLAWAESSAVAYANSVIGARTNRESGISAIASAIIGKTPCYGMHIKENRAPKVFVKVKEDINPSLLGYKLGSELDGIPIFEFKRRLSDDELKQLGASLASTGNIAIFHVKDQTPEWKDFEIPKEKIEIDSAEVKAECEPDLIALGCPHLSKDELLMIARFAERFDRVKIPVWLFVSRKVYEECYEAVKKLESKGIKVFRDTCMVVSPATERFECIMVDSGKAMTYLPKLRKVDVTFGSTEECLRRAFE